MVTQVVVMVVVDATLLETLIIPIGLSIATSDIGATIVVCVAVWLLLLLLVVVTAVTVVVAAFVSTTLVAAVVVFVTDVVFDIVPIVVVDVVPSAVIIDMVPVVVASDETLPLVAAAKNAIVAWALLEVATAVKVLDTREADVTTRATVVVVVVVAVDEGVLSLVPPYGF